MQATVFVVEDEPALQDILRGYLQRAGYRVETFRSGSRAWQAILQQAPDLVVLDIMLPDLDGLTVLQRLRQTGNRVPVILLTAKSEQADRIAGLAEGADDYVVKPCAPTEVVLRVQAVLRRTRPGADDALTVGPLVVYPGRRQVAVEGEAIALTPTEFRILTTLLEHPGWTFSRQQLLDRCAGPDFDGFDRNIDVHIANLRKKLRLKPSPIRTVYGVGYRFEPPEAP